MAIQHLQPGTTYAIHLRAPSVSGGKDWVGSVAPDGIHTFWGKTGNINQHTAKKGTMTSLQGIINEKMAKGYEEVDEYFSQNGWNSQQQQQSPQASASPQPAKPFIPKGPAINIINPAAAPDAMAPIDWDF